MKEKGTIAILCGGGPAPGINTVVSTIAKVFLQDKYRVIGVHGGFENLFKGKPHLLDFDYYTAENIYKQGGSALRMSRYKPKDSEFKYRVFYKKRCKAISNCRW